MKLSDSSLLILVDIIGAIALICAGVIRLMVFFDVWMK